MKARIFISNSFISSNYNSIFILAFLPIALVLVDSTWIYPRPDTVDPWMYISYFLDPQIQMMRFPHDYHASRLPIIWPGVFFFRIFSPQVAIVALHLAIYYVAIFSLYTALFSLFNKRIALLASVLCGTYTMFLSSIGQTHADSFGIAYSLLTIALIARGLVGPRWRLPLFLAGGCASLIVYTNLAYLPLCTYFILFLCIAKRDLKRKPLFVGFVFGIGGLLTMTVILCLSNLWLNGKPWFFLQSIQYASSNIGIKNVCSDPNPGYHWINHATWLIVPSLTLMGSLFALWKTNTASLNLGKNIQACLVGFIVVFLLMGVCESIGFLTYLQFSFYASMLMPSMFMAIGALMSLSITTWKNVDYIGAIGVLICMALISVSPSANLFFGPFVIVSSVTVSVISLLIPYNKNMCNLKILALVYLIGYLNIFLNLEYKHFINAWPLERKHVNAVEFIGKWRDGSHDYPITRSSVIGFVAKVFQILNPIYQEKRFRFWFSTDEPMGSVFTAISSTHLWHQSFVTPNFPSLFAFNQARSLNEGERIVVLSARERDVPKDLESVFSEKGLSYKLRLEQDFFESDEMPIKITIIDTYKTNE